MRKHARLHSVVKIEGPDMINWILNKLNLASEIEDNTITETFASPTELGAFEAALIAQIISSQQPKMIPLLQTLKLLETHYTGHGMYFETTSAKYYEDELNDLPSGQYRNIGVENFESPQLVYGGGAVLYFKDHEISSLEVYGYGEVFPKVITEWSFLLD